MRIKETFIYLLHLIISSEGAVKENRCPDEDLQTECSGFCRVDYNRCRLLCETEYCQSICDREYQNCQDNCPCGANCEEGCKDCNHPLCSSTTTVSTWTTTSQNSDPSNDYVLVIPTYSAQSYIFSGDGEVARSASIDVPRDDYAALSDFAVVRGEFYIFGGDTDHHKIAKLENCRFYEMPTRLFYGYDVASAAIDIDGGQRGFKSFKKITNEL
ncbi:Oidioi.mRNA.OKI2018_I69.chr2.g5003.t1.cds [Oikopleura dioica]|uniref:Oidioi.mRNA.OKI2018_I69.chr2.g5003.t1.cds n=1 Tax=Oikopleura dioica TaxID=34765 RepID=A0ABN7T2F5_OIKDI|nr:Oidioi.mRNA.OKI2018_I69.chr2.g5003.t1.cds [Oikopleura dioica]